MKAWELLEEKGWCQNAWARDEAGCAVSVHSDRACSFCIQGALDRVSAGVPVSESVELHISLFFGWPITDWNDQPGRTKEEVVALLKELDV